tara:strand:+ start:3494 stop:4321 length:828 start_codon:yes stop_codon:yes gene_type:complete
MEKKAMTDIVLSEGGMTPEQLMTRMGAKQDAPQGMLELKVNSQSDDDEGKPLPRGSFYLKGDSPVHYAEKVQFRPLTQHYMYTHYSPEEEKVINRTIQMTSFREEPRDMKGTLRCGKPSGAGFRDLPDEEKAKYEHITAFRVVRGLVSFTGKDLDGNEKTYKNEPCVLRLKGSNFMPFSEQVENKMPKSANLLDHNLNLTTKRNKNGSVVWFTFEYEIDLKKKLPFTQEVYDTLVVLDHEVTAYNVKVDKAYYEALAKDTLDNNVMNTLEFQEAS